jgi:hypothetical protein
MRALAILTMFWSATASAAWPEDVSVSAMTEYEGVRVVDPDLLSEAYRELIRELGVAVGTHSVLPAETLGIRNFEVVADTAVSFTSTQGLSNDPSPWQRAHPTHEPGQVFYQPGFTIRKGLGFSVEVGLGARWVGNSRQAVVHGFVRAAIAEGYKPWPDVNIHLGYSGYVGNDELQVGVFEAGLTLGTKVPFGAGQGPRTAKLSPFLDASILTITSTPKVDDATLEAVQPVTYGRRGGDPELAPVERALVVGQFSGGFQLVAGQLVFRVSGGWATGTMPFVASSLGFVY